MPANTKSAVVLGLTVAEPILTALVATVSSMQVAPVAAAVSTTTTVAPAATVPVVASGVTATTAAK